MAKLSSFVSFSVKSIQFIWCRSKEYLILTFASIILSAVSVFPGMYLINCSIDLLTKHVDFRKYLLTVGIIILIMLFFSGVLMLIGTRLGYVKNRFYSKIRLEISKICINTDYANIQKKSFLENKKFALVVASKGSLDLFINSMQSVISSFIVIVGVIYIISEVSLILLIPIALALVIDLYNDWLNARQNFIDTKEEIEYSRKSGYLQNISSDFAYAKEIRMFNLKERFKRRMDEVDDLLFKLREQRRKRRRPLAILAYGSDTILDIAIYLYLGYKVISSAISLGRFALYSSALRQLKNSVSEVIYIITEFVVNTEYLKGFFEFMEQRAEKKKEISAPRPAKAEICFEHVSFKYPESDIFALKDVNITINAGETLLIVGENGAGKTTFVRLLCGLYRPTEGRILFNGRDITTIPTEEYLGYISTVFQDFKLFAMSIAENICALNDDDEKRVDDALKKVDLQDKVKQTSKGKTTQLYRIFDKDGVEFSGGEMQRLAIARAVYKDSTILIMDEPTSALDPKAEYEIYSGFRRIAEGRTSVYISHRLSSVKFSDRIAVFNKGEIAELGTHDELMEKKGMYAELYSIQANLYKQEAVK